jgi:hypothetical protein
MHIPITFSMPKDLRRRNSNVASEGASAAHPIVLCDDERPLLPLPGSSVHNAIILSDSDGDATTLAHPNATTTHQLPILEGPRSKLYDEFTLASRPTLVPFFRRNVDPYSVSFPDIDVDKCCCIFRCARGSCVNASSAIYCDKRNCAVGLFCGNRLRDHSSLALMACIKGYGVIATAHIPAQSVIAEYTGTVVTARELTQAQIDRGFVLQFKSRSESDEIVFVDASMGGRISRFINHSCSPNSRFEEWSNRTSRKMAVVTNEDILPGNEITTKYAEHINFACKCNAAHCCTVSIIS